MGKQDYIIEMRNITKVFPGVRALHNVDFELIRGEMHALVGENGAGKSTLIKILGGMFKQTQGCIFKDGEEVSIINPADSINIGIGTIYQEFHLVPTLTIYENIFLGKEQRTKLGTMDRMAMRIEAGGILKQLGMEQLDCNKLVKDLSVAQKQLLEIAKALYHESEILIMDEPTAVLTNNEIKKLFEIIALLKKRGVSIIYISHRLEEITEICDRITVLRDGEYIDTINNHKRSVSKEEIIKLMVGRELNQYFPKKKADAADEVVLDVKGISKKGMYRDISFDVRKGEILGFAGLIGAGRSEVMKTIYGIIQKDTGEIRIKNKKLKGKNPIDTIKQGICLIPEDRKKEGLVLGLSAATNISISNEKEVSRNGVVSNGRTLRFVSKLFKSLLIKPDMPEREAGLFSGGNQQKIVIAKWLEKSPSVLIMDEPTRGIDVGAKAEIYQLMRSLTEKGTSIILVSSELNEVIGMSDRIVAMYEGQITVVIERDEFDEELIMKAASGIEVS